MRPTKIWANLGVKDVITTRKFYSALGFKPNEGYDKTDEITSFLFGNDDFVINFFVKDSLKNALRGEIADLSKGKK